MATSRQHKIKLWLHVCQVTLMIGALGVALVITMNPVFIGGANRTPMSARVGISMAGKGLVFAFYQILTENVRFCKRFASTKANMILNCIEVVAWPAAAGVTVYGIIQFCVGISCTLSYVMIPLAVVLAIISGFAAWISIKEHREFKRTGIKPADMKLETMRSEDSNKAFNSSSNEEAGVPRYETEQAKQQSTTTTTTRQPSPAHQRQQQQYAPNQGYGGGGQYQQHQHQHQQQYQPQSERQQYAGHQQQQHHYGGGNSRR